MSASAARWLVIACASLAVVGCASTATPKSTPATLFPAADSTSTSTTTASSTPPEPVGNFEQTVARTLPTDSDAPDGYEFSTVDLATEYGGFCDGSAPATDQWITAAAGAVNFEGDHFFRTDVEVYAESDDAEAAGAYQADAIIECSGSVRTDDDTGEVVRIVSGDGGPYDLPGADEAAVKNLQLATDTFAIDTVLIHARVDNVLLVAQGSDSATTAYFMDLLIARLLDEPDPAFVAPADDPSIVTVDESDDDGNAALLAELLPTLVLRPEANDWLATADVATLQEVADIVCPRLAELQAGDDTMLIYLDAFTETERASLDNESGDQVMVAITAAYCPEVFEQLVD